MKTEKNGKTQRTIPTWGWTDYMKVIKTELPARELNSADPKISF